ncbi:SMP-30/gluconolactonase/LRE family protein [Serratia sp. IR-2025]|uniref:SMP-30/gluconolactonase/LRE family protein n=1 Tax=Serratia marcescens TaxID=615 RepID=A0ABD5BN28_SERMA|nr:SMP-30/gluconolactonase/LRE family protein [Serratia marcescens]MDE5234636.1 SMP-30/gluconolactonase/LRE family protein [Serratia marcescens]MDE5257197.1 SMP-30/gluconolactonase/LRE family protein [Serratia marcescens]MDQ9380681.1 SMP-30/gluconolactonase/LRE family protein [Serratia marcescens]MDQ9403048.1 SMP-30/gluconolactonase/LRE family protein [Serratia marcescens]MDQ9425706.1 SMP-30/gluconolactonase/LRE family protein [Serratia marcescens]
MFRFSLFSFLLPRCRRLTQLAGAALFLSGVMQAQATQRIEFSPDAAGAYPEGIAWNARAGAFLVSSLRGGQLGLVYPDGRYRRFSTGSGLITTSGMLVDAERNRVLVCNEDVGVSLNSASGTRNRVAQVLEFNLDTGALQQTYDLSSLSRGPTLANDLALDVQGNIYVTDSFQPQIYKIDRATRQVSILVRSARLMPADAPAAAQGTQPYLNGIVYHPDGYLIAADYTRGLLWKVTLDNASAISEIRLPQRLKGPDGLRLKNAHELVIVQSYPGRKGGMSGNVTLLASSDGWASAHLAAVATPPGLDGPTGAALRDGEVWVVNSRYPRLFADVAQAERTRTFSIVRVALERRPADRRWLPTQLE